MICSNLIQVQRVKWPVEARLQRRGTFAYSRHLDEGKEEQVGSEGS